MRAREITTASAGAVALAISVLAIGGVPRWAMALVAVAVAVALAAQLTSRRRLERRSPLVIVLLVATGLTALQAVPLPPAVGMALAPVPHDLVNDTYALTGDADAWRPLSVDPPGTYRALLLLTILVGVALVALRLAASEAGRYRLLAAVAALCGASAAIVGVHQLLGLDALYGVYAPREASTRLLGPLLNPNHLGSLMSVGVLLGLGLAAHARQPTWRRVAWAGSALACLAVLLATYSRGATIAVGLGAVVLVATLVLQRATASHRDRRTSLLTSVPVALIVACAVALVIHLAGGGVGGELDRTSVDEIARPATKYDAWRASAQLVREAPWTGVGRGGFESAFTRVYPPSATGIFSHLENEYLQAVVDWGIPGAAALALALGYLGVVMLRRWRGGALAAAALAALVAVGVQSLVDFGAELPGLAVPLVIIAATLSYVPLVRAPREAPLRRLAPRVAPLVALALAAALALPPWGRTVTEDHRHLLDAGSPLPMALATSRRHPLDYVAAGNAAVAAMRARDPRAVRLLNHALMLHPTHPGLHRQGARLLLRNRRVEQAALEYAIAVRGSTEPAALVEELVRALPTDAARLRALPLDRRDVTPVVAALEEEGRVDLAIAYLERLTARRPRELRLAERLFALAVREERLDVAVAAARDLATREPIMARRLALARLLMKTGGEAEVLTLLADVATSTGGQQERATAWLLRCEAARALRQFALARACLDELAASPVMTTKLGAQVTAARARVAREEQAPPPPVEGAAFAPSAPVAP
ncbi:MAG: O-antigen ligase family protein [Kofleriaceae bacterium]